MELRTSTDIVKQAKSQLAGCIGKSLEFVEVGLSEMEGSAVEDLFLGEVRLKFDGEPKLHFAALAFEFPVFFSTVLSVESMLKTDTIVHVKIHPALVGLRLDKVIAYGYEICLILLRFEFNKKVLFIGNGNGEAPWTISEFNFEYFGLDDIFVTDDKDFEAMVKREGLKEIFTLRLP